MSRRWIFAVLAITVAIVALSLWRLLAVSDAPAQVQPESVDDVAKLLDQLGWTVAIGRDEPDDVIFSVTFPDGNREDMSAETLAARLRSESSGRSWLNTVLNITSPIGIVWVSIGLLGQVLFTGRMIVQWLASERKRQSVVPAAFWWMSLGGASMLIIYFIWRKDIVGILGQGLGWAVYVRNLHLLYSHSRPAPATADPSPNPESDEYAVSTSSEAT